MTGVAGQPVSAAFGAVSAWLEGDPERAEPPATAADQVAEIFGLDRFARNILLLSAYAALEPSASRQIAALHGDDRRNVPSVGLALAQLPDAHWSAFAPQSPLRAFGLISIDDSNLTAGSAFTLSDAILFFLLGAPALSAATGGMARKQDAPGRLAPARAKLAAHISARIVGRRGDVLQLCGLDPVGKKQAAAAACAENGKRLFVINALTLPSGTQEIAAFARHWRRDLALLDAWLLVDADSLMDNRPLVLFAELIERPLFVAAPEVVQLGTVKSLRLEMPRAKASEHVPIWRNALGPLAKKMNGSVERLASAFQISPELVETVAAELQQAQSAFDTQLKAGKAGAKAEGAGRNAKAKTPDLEGLAWSACRQYARPRMDDLARRVDSQAKWDELVLPESQKAVLRAIAAQVRNRAVVYEDWGWAKRAGGRGLGISALFAGPSGAGKTLAGEVLGAELNLDVYRVDLSSIVSKWMGETEKNLRRIFDAADEGSVILQFDEADAIFGKRSEVKDSHDRNANVEVSYLLQRFEEYRGLSILTTNLRGNIDQAFLRRIRFIVDFTFPSADERKGIWEKTFPKTLPREELDFGRLSQLNLTGGSIRNIAMSAAFLAADQGRKLSMEHILPAARLEYEKSGRVITDVELRGWAR